MIASVLVIDDDVLVQEFLLDLLNKNNFVVRSCLTGAQALKMVESTPPDLVLLDLGLPDIDGQSVLAKIRELNVSMPVLILSGSTSVQDKVDTLSVGADDYITKPFNNEELVARIRARLKQAVNHEILRLADLEVDLAKVTVSRKGKVIALTPHEYNLLVYLLQNTGRVLSRDQILNRVWSYTTDVETRVVDVYMGYLRKKIDTGHKTKLIQSVRGFGYTIKE